MDTDDTKNLSEALHWVVEHRKLAPCKRLHTQREVLFTELAHFEKDRPALAAEARAFRQRLEDAEQALAAAHADFVAGVFDEPKWLTRIEACAETMEAVGADVEKARGK